MFLLEHTNIFHSGQTEEVTFFQTNKSDLLHFFQRPASRFRQPLRSRRQDRHTEQGTAPEHLHLEGRAPLQLHAPAPGQGPPRPPGHSARAQHLRALSLLVHAFHEARLPRCTVTGVHEVHF